MPVSNMAMIIPVPSYPISHSCGAPILPSPWLAGIRETRGSLSLNSASTQDFLTSWRAAISAIVFAGTLADMALISQCCWMLSAPIFFRKDTSFSWLLAARDFAPAGQSSPRTSPGCSRSSIMMGIFCSCPVRLFSNRRGSIFMSRSCGAQCSR